LVLFVWSLIQIAASALDYAKSLRVITNCLHKVTLASFYQASESIYQQFDRVLLLDKGRCIYFGRRSEAKQHFLDLGFDCEDRKSTPDFLTGVTNPLERRVRAGFEDIAPQNSAGFEEAFRNSDHYTRAIAEMQAYEKQIEQEVRLFSFFVILYHSLLPRGSNGFIESQSRLSQGAVDTKVQEISKVVPVLSKHL
jgi:ABC-type multidrug transport system ATPase subunit